MPIYEYHCTSCKKTSEILQGIHEPLATECPFCGESELVKKISAAGFQLKGEGWYATDYKKPKTPEHSSENSAPSSDASTAAEVKPSGESKTATTDTASSGTHSQTDS